MSAAQHTPGPWEVLDHEGVHVLAEGGLTVATIAHQLDYAGVEGRTQIQNARLIAAAPALLSVVQEAVRIQQAALILADGMDSTGKLFTEAQRADARAFLAKRSAVWLGAAFDSIAKATGSAP